jgi:hypothetical protein
MKKVITLTESELVNLIGRIVEDIDISNYEESDFYDAFISHFKPWVIKTHGEEVLKYPLSYLSGKYSKEFTKSIGMNTDEENGQKTIRNIGRYILSKELHRYSSPVKTTKFTEKYKKPLEALIKSLDLPKYISIKLYEEDNYKVFVQFYIDFPKLMNSDATNRKPIKDYFQKLRNDIRMLLGVKFGNAHHGELELYSVTLDTEHDGEGSIDWWVQNVLNKEIKSQIRNIPNSKKILHSIKFEPDTERLKGLITLIFRQQTTYEGFKAKTDFVVKVHQLLVDMGYSSKILDVIF